MNVASRATEKLLGLSIIAQPMSQCDWPITKFERSAMAKLGNTIVPGCNSVPTNERQGASQVVGQSVR